MKLDRQDLSWIIRLIPFKLKELMLSEKWAGKVFLGGGFIRACIARETLSDIDLFVPSKDDAERLANELKKAKNLIKTDNAFTVIDYKVPIQVIFRWVFDKPEDVSNSFDFTICCAVIYVEKTENPIITILNTSSILPSQDQFIYKFDSYCDDRFYIDLASKRLVYRRPVRNEDAGGSMLRVLKYYQRGYRIPLDSLGYVIARLVAGVDENVDHRDQNRMGHVLSVLLREVDPNTDPTHEAHLPSMEVEEPTENAT